MGRYPGTRSVTYKLEEKGPSGVHRTLKGIFDVTGLTLLELLII